MKKETDITQEMAKIQAEEKGYREVKRIFLYLSQKVIFAYPYDKEKSWLNRLDKAVYGHHLTDEFIDILTSAGMILPKQEEALRDQDSLALVTIQTEPKENYNAEHPISVFAKVEESGVLSTVAFFSEDEATISRVETATLSAFEVDWLSSDF